MVWVASLVDLLQTAKVSVLAEWRLVISTWTPTCSTACPGEALWSLVDSPPLFREKVTKASSSRFPQLVEALGATPGKLIGLTRYLPNSTMWDLAYLLSPENVYPSQIVLHCSKGPTLTTNLQWSVFFLFQGSYPIRVVTLPTTLQCSPSPAPEWSLELRVSLCRRPLICSDP